MNYRSHTTQRSVLLSLAMLMGLSNVPAHAWMSSTITPVINSISENKQRALCVALLIAAVFRFKMKEPANKDPRYDLTKIPFADLKTATSFKDFMSKLSSFSKELATQVWYLLDDGLIGRAGKRPATFSLSLPDGSMSKPYEFDESKLKLCAFDHKGKQVVFQLGSDPKWPIGLGGWMHCYYTTFEGALKFAAVLVGCNKLLKDGWLDWAYYYDNGEKRTVREQPSAEVVALQARNELLEQQNQTLIQQNTTTNEVIREYMRFMAQNGQNTQTTLNNIANHLQTIAGAEQDSNKKE